MFFLTWQEINSFSFLERFKVTTYCCYMQQISVNFLTILSKIDEMALSIAI